MESLQNLTKPESTANSEDTSAKPQSEEELLKARQAQYIDFCAVGGLLTADDGTMKPMRAEAFAATVGVSRQTLYNWQKSIPNFWAKVTQRRKDLGGQNRIQKVWNGVYLKAASGNPQAAALWLANHDPDFRMPTQKLEHDVGGGLADLLQQARKLKQIENTQKVIDAEATNNNT